MPSRRTETSSAAPGQPVTTEYLDRKFQDLEQKFMTMLQAKNDEIASLNEMVTSLKSKVSKLESSIDDADAYERRDTVIIAGSSIPNETAGEICTNLVTSIVKEKLKLQISPSDISTAHRLGRKNNNQVPDCRNFIVKFCRRDVKKQVIVASRKLRNAGIYVNESLTPLRRSIFNTVRSMKRAHPDLVKGCSSYEGRVYVYTSPANPSQTRDRRHLLSSNEDLKEFCREYIKQPLENFLTSMQN